MVVCCLDKLGSKKIEKGILFYFISVFQLVSFTFVV